MDDRAVSTVVSYILALGILAIFVSGLVVSFAPYVTDQQQATTQSTMQVFGNDIAGDIGTVDRLSNRTGTDGTVELRTRLPERVGGNTYEIEIKEGSAGGNAYEIWLRADNLEASAVVRVRTRTPLASSSLDDPIDGGTLRIRYDASADELVVEHA